MFGAGDGMAGTKWTPGRECGAMSRTTALLTEPTSETMAPGLVGAIFGDRGVSADRDGEDHQIRVIQPLPHWFPPRG